MHARETKRRKKKKKLIKEIFRNDRQTEKIMKQTNNETNLKAKSNRRIR